jgi:hypothetical protein
MKQYIHETECILSISYTGISSYFYEVPRTLCAFLPVLQELQNPAAADIHYTLCSAIHGINVRPSVMLMTIHTYMKPVASGYILTDH